VQSKVQSALVFINRFCVGWLSDLQCYLGHSCTSSWTRRRFRAVCTGGSENQEAFLKEIGHSLILASTNRFCTLHTIRRRISRPALLYFLNYPDTDNTTLFVSLRSCMPTTING